MKKSTTIDELFKRKFAKNSEVNVSSSTSTPNTHDVQLPTTPIDSTSNFENPPIKSRRIEVNEVDTSDLVRDPGLRPRIWDFNANHRDEIRRAYIKAGAYQPMLSKYPKSGPESHLRSFNPLWFKSFSWLEYSLEKDVVFCLYCYLFSKPSGNSGNLAFTVDGFRNWKKVKDGKNCALLNHVGKDPNSFHKVAEKAYFYLMNQHQHIQRFVDKYTSEQILANRLRLKASIDAIRWLAFQGCAFRGRDESKGSTNRGNFIEMITLLSSYNEKVAEVVLDKAPQNATYTSLKIQKELLHVISEKVKKEIREEIGDAKFCIIVDEARDESKREQMSIVLRFVDKDGILKERFFGLVRVTDTTALTLKKGIYSILSHHNLDINSIRGQGYDGASNMRGEWNGLQALILNDCPFAYYVHCLAHRLQLTLVAASREVIPVHQFFTKLNFIVNIVGASCKRNEELRIAQVAEFSYLIANDELVTGRGLNQIGTLQRPGDTRWSSHLKSVSSLIRLFSATCEVLINTIEDGTTPTQRGDADSAFESLTSYEFVFILHLMKEILSITDLLCQALQSQSQDILNAMHLVSSTKTLIQKLRDDGWNELSNKVKVFCEARNIDVPDMIARYVARRGRARHQQDEFTIEHHYRIDIFYATIDSQLQELNRRFNEHVVELLILSSALDPRNMREFFREDDIYNLIENFYPEDFSHVEKMQAKTEIQHFKHNVVQLPEFKNLSTLSEMCHWLVRTRRSTVYQLVYRVIVLVLTLPVSTATTERSFSAMNIVKSRLRNKMEDEFLTDSLILFIEKEIAAKFSIDSIIDDFRDLNERRVPL